MTSTYKISGIQAEKLATALQALADTDTHIQQKQSPISGTDIYAACLATPHCRDGARSYYRNQLNALRTFFAQPKWGLTASTRHAFMRMISNSTQAAMYQDLNTLLREVSATVARPDWKHGVTNLHVVEEDHTVTRVAFVKSTK